MNLRKSVLLKKVWRHGARLPRCWRRMSASPETYRGSPPVLVNSFPKSGTHLLVQVLSVLPGMRDWGDFWASQPSFSFREQEVASMAARISRVAPGELVCGHLYHSERVAQSLASRHVAHFFIYRDPRDVVVSEAHYLAKMNRWHRLHGRFRRLPTQAARVMLSIRGLPEGDVYYPNIAKRFERFAGWLRRADVSAVTYEDLMSERRFEVITRIVDFYRRHANLDLDLPAVVRQAAAAVQPGSSHTFRQGGSGGWRREFDARMKEEFKEVAGDLLIQLGYERSFEW